MLRNKSRAPLRIAAGLVLLSACPLGCATTSPPAPEAPQSYAPEDGEGCAGTPTAAELLVALADAVPALSTGHLPIVSMARLSGGSARHAALIIRSPGDLSGDHPGVPVEDEATDHLWVFACSQDAWEPIGHEAFDATRDNGTFDYEVGPGVIEHEVLLDLAGEGHDLLRLVTEQVHGGADPRWTETRMVLFAVVEGELRRVFDCAPSQDDVSGPSRASVATQREITIRRAQPTTIRVQRAVRRDAVDMSDAERGLAASEADSQAESTHTWNGALFEPGAIDVCR